MKTAYEIYQESGSTVPFVQWAGLPDDFQFIDDKKEAVGIPWSGERVPEGEIAVMDNTSSVPGQKFKGVTYLTVKTGPNEPNPFQFDVNGKVKTTKWEGLHELVKEAHDCAVEHGWWSAQTLRKPHDGRGPYIDIGLVEKQIPEKVCLMHSELSEALEEYRNGHIRDGIYKEEGKEKPEGFSVELADTVIRIFDLIGALNMTDEFVCAMENKMKYNQSRPFRHGGKKA